MSNERALKKAVSHMLRRMQDDGRVAWLLGPGTEAYDQLTAAFAAACWQEPEKFRRLYEPTLKPEAWPRSSGLSGETIALREEVCAAWHAVPDELRKDARLTRLYHALGGPHMEEPGVCGVPASGAPRWWRCKQCQCDAPAENVNLGPTHKTCGGAVTPADGVSAAESSRKE